MFLSFNNSKFQPLLSTRFTAAAIDKRLESLTRVGKKAVSSAKDCIVEEFESINNDKEALLFISCKEGRQPENVKKNRYRNVVPYDHTRIRLRFSIHSLTDPSTSNDYINANWIEVTSPDASNQSKWAEYGDFNRRFISTQGPLAETLSDFWRMVWQEDCKVVVALTREVERGRVKCARYWPEHVGEEVEFESAGEKFLVKSVASEELGDYTTRLLELTKLRMDDGEEEEGESHVIYHYQFLGWLDNSEWCNSRGIWWKLSTWFQAAPPTQFCSSSMK